jgi:hypothetical protein
VWEKEGQGIEGKGRRREKEKQGRKGSDGVDCIATDMRYKGESKAKTKSRARGGTGGGKGQTKETVSSAPTVIKHAENAPAKLLISQYAFSKLAGSCIALAQVS